MTIKQEIELCALYEALYKAVPMGHVIVHSIAHYPFIHMWVVSGYRALELQAYHTGFKEVEFSNPKTGIKVKI